MSVCSAWMMGWVVILSLWISATEGMKFDQIKSLRCVYIQVITFFWISFSFGAMKLTTSPGDC